MFLRSFGRIFRETPFGPYRHRRSNRTIYAHVSLFFFLRSASPPPEFQLSGERSAMIDSYAVIFLIRVKRILVRVPLRPMGTWQSIMRKMCALLDPPKNCQVSFRLRSPLFRLGLALRYDLLRVNRRAFTFLSPLSPRRPPRADRTEGRRNIRSTAIRAGQSSATTRNARSVIGHSVYVAVSPSKCTLIIIKIEEIKLSI